MGSPFLLQALGGVAEWSCSGLQSRGRRFDSDPRLQRFPPQSGFARVVKLVDTGDLKSPGLYRPCRFESGPGHHCQLRPSLSRE